MEYDEIMGTRLSVLEARIASLEQQLFVLTQGGALIQKRRKRNLTDEEKRAIRERLVKGQEVARARRETEAKKQMKEVKDGQETKS